LEINQAVILAGGSGKRLWPLTRYIPKPMVEVEKKPFLEYIIQQLYDQGIGKILILTGYKGDKIIEHFGDGLKFGVDIDYSIGEIDDKTGKRMKKAEDLLDRNFLMVYCDTLCNLNLKDLLYAFKSNGRLCMTTAYTNPDGKGEYGKDNNLMWDDNNIVLSYNLGDKRINNTGINIGYYLINRKVVKYMPEENISFESDFFYWLIKRKQLTVYPTDKRYFYLTLPDDIKKFKGFKNEFYK